MRGVERRGSVRRSGERWEREGAGEGGEERQGEDGGVAWEGSMRDGEAMCCGGRKERGERWVGKYS